MVGYDDSACACGRTLPETVQPFTWHDHGFCAVGCALACDQPFDVRGTVPALELARMSGGRGPGFEDALVRDWERELRAVDGGLIWLAKRHGTDDQTRASADSWAWRVYLTDTRGSFVRCLAFRLTAKAGHWPRTYRETTKVGAVPYTVSFHDGETRHADGSAFYDIRLFKNRRIKDAFVKSLERQGYTEGGR